MPNSEQNVFFRIKDKTTGQYFSGGRRGVNFDIKGMRYETLQPVTAALKHIEGERERAVELIKVFSECADAVDYVQRVVYWQGVFESLDPKNFEVIKYREVIEAIETVIIK